MIIYRIAAGESRVTYGSEIEPNLHDTFFKESQMTDETQEQQNNNEGGKTIIVHW